MWEHHPDRRTPAGGALGLHPPAVGLHEMLHDSEPQTGTPLIPGAGGVRAVEPFEHSRQMLAYGTNLVSGVTSETVSSVPPVAGPAATTMRPPGGV